MARQARCTRARQRQNGKGRAIKASQNRKGGNAI